MSMIDSFYPHNINYSMQQLSQL